MNIILLVILICVIPTYTLAAIMFGDVNGKLIALLFGKRIANGVSRLFESIFFGATPTVQIIHAFVLCAIEYGAYTSVFPLFGSGSSQPYIWSFLILSCFLIALLCSLTDPGVVTKDTIDKMIQVFPYDDLLYKENNECRTCHLPKPARSKHCSLCNRCVYKFDHHCVWVNNDIGLYNYKYFLFYLWIHMISCIYVCLSSLYLLAKISKAYGLFEVTYYDAAVGHNVHASTSVILIWLLQHYQILCCIFLTTGLFAVCLLLFFFLHIGYIFKNQTTNEVAKWYSINYNFWHFQNKNWFNYIFGIYPRDYPQHIYNHGLLSTLCEVVFPSFYISRILVHNKTD
ncbi:hypothetical protein WA158_002680 [Blastocystis sp. Blastoise]